jgi:hypothetical protein
MGRRQPPRASHQCSASGNIDEAESHPNKGDTVPNLDEGMRRDIPPPPEALKLRNSETLSISLEHSLASCSESRHQ